MCAVIFVGSTNNKTFSKTKSTITSDLGESPVFECLKYHECTAR